MPENRKLWREMQEPHESMDAVNAAVNAFFDDLGALREKHRLADVLVVGRVVMMDGEDERESLIPIFYGDSMRAEALSAYAYGHYASERQKMIGDLVSGKALVKIKDRK